MPSWVALLLRNMTALKEFSCYSIENGEILDIIEIMNQFAF